MAPTPASQRLNCSLLLTLAPSLTCLSQDFSTASPSCLGGGLLSVEAEAEGTTLTRAYLGLQETQAGRLSLPWGTSNDFFQIFFLQNWQWGENSAHGMDASISAGLHCPTWRLWLCLVLPSNCNTSHCRSSTRFFNVVYTRFIFAQMAKNLHWVTAGSSPVGFLTKTPSWWLEGSGGSVEAKHTVLLQGELFSLMTLHFSTN